MNRFGEISNNTKGTKMKIIRYESIADIDVEFLDEYHYVAKSHIYQNFKKGTIKNPYDITVFGFGYLGEGERMAKINGEITDSYQTWRNIIRRCYVENAADKFNSYHGICDICKEWLNFQVFAEWYEDNKYKVNVRLHIDKDILYQGNKIYSPSHCLLVPQRINMIFMNKANNRGLPNGISKSNNKFYAKYNTEDLGSFDDLENAYKVYANKKEEHIRLVADEYKNKIPKKVYDALIKYRVLIEADKNYIIS